MSDNTDHARRWATLITSDTDAALDLFADELLYDDRRDIDHVYDTATDKAQLRARIAPFANADPDNGLGIHHFEVLDVIDAAGVNGARAVAIVWQWTGEHLENFRGVPAGGRSLSARGQTWHQFDAAGKITASRRTGTTSLCTSSSGCRSSPRRTGRPDSTRPRLLSPRELRTGDRRCFPSSGASACACRSSQRR